MVKLPEGLYRHPNCEVYYNGEYIGRVQPSMGTRRLTDIYGKWYVNSPGEDVLGEAESEKAGILILYMTWLKKSNRVEGAVDVNLARLGHG
jgi:hypothetical protein